MTIEADEKQVAIVTGAARGIGLAVTERLLSDGHAVMLIDLDGDAVTTALAGFPPALRGCARAMRCDVTNEVDLERVVLDTSAALGSPTWLVNSAGLLGPLCLPRYYPVDTFRRVVEVNQTGLFLAMQAVVPAMVDAGGGSIVNLASTAAKEGPCMLSGYAASKAAVIALTKCFARDLVQDGVRVNCVTPTLTGDTGMAEAMTDRFREDSLEQIPMGRAAAPDEVASVVTFLLSQQASYVTGQCYDVSGGRSVF